MKRFILKLGLFVLMNASAGLAALALLDARYSFEQWQTDSLLLSTPRNTDYDLVILGTSHARLLTRFKYNYEFLTRELDMRILNLAIPFGGGVLLEKMYFRNFFDRGNTAKTVLYFLDPYVFFSSLPNKYHKFVYYEPIRFSFLARMICHGMPFERVFTYIRSKFSWRWLTQKPILIAYDGIQMADYGISMDPERMRARAESLYPEGLDETSYASYAPMLDEVIAMGRERGCRVIIVFPPTLLGPEKGASRVKQLLDACRERHAFEFHDLTDAVPEPDLYSDYDHLNSKGVELFITQHIKPILEGA